MLPFIAYPPRAGCARVPVALGQLRLDSRPFTRAAAMLLRRPVDIGLLVRDRRRAAGWSQAVLAERVGSSRQWVVDLERGNSGAEIGRVLRALSVLGVSLDALVAHGAPSDTANHSRTGARTSGTGPERGGSDASGTDGRWISMPSLEEVLDERADAPSRTEAPDRRDGPPRAADASAARASAQRETKRGRGTR